MLYRSGMPRGCRKGVKCQNTNRGIWMQQSANHSSHISTQTGFSFQHQHSQCTSSYGESTWFAAASHPPSQSNNRRSANTWEAPSARYSLAMTRSSLQAHYMIRWSSFSSTSCLMHGTLIDSYACTFRDLLKESSVSGIKCVTRPHHHVIPDSYKYIHNANLTEQSPLS